MHIQESGEMYLETIFVLSKERSFVRAIDVGEHLGYSKPSVSRAMSLLKTGGYIIVDTNGAISLTEEGLALAQKMYERHLLISKLLAALGVDAQTAADDACKIEHVISDVSFEALKSHAEKFLSKQ